MSLTEREKQLLRREGYREGARDNEAEHRASLRCHHWVEGGWQRLAEEKYPLPTIRANRIETARVGNRPDDIAEFTWHRETPTSSPTIAWRRRSEGEGWNFDTFTRFQYAAAEQPELLRLWADLLEKPFREVEDPGPILPAPDPGPARHADTCAKNYGLGSHRDLIECTCNASKPLIANDANRSRHHTHCAHRHDESKPCNCGVGV